MTAEGYVYELIFEGLNDDSPDALRRLKGVFIADLNLSVEEVQNILQSSPTPIFKSPDKTEVQRCMSALKSAGAKVLLVSPKNESENGESVSSSESEDGSYVIEFDLNDSSEQPATPKEPKTYSLDPVGDEDLLDGDTPILDLSATHQSSDEPPTNSLEFEAASELNLDEASSEVVQPAKTQDSGGVKKAPSMLGSSPLISAPASPASFGLSLDDDEATSSSAVADNTSATAKTAVNMDQPVIPAEITAKQLSQSSQLDESSGLDELLAIAEHNQEEKKNLFDDLAIREMDEQSLVESAVKSPDDDFSLDFKPDAPSKVQARPASPTVDLPPPQAPAAKVESPKIPKPSEAAPTAPQDSSAAAKTEDAPNAAFNKKSNPTSSNDSSVSVVKQLTEAAEKIASQQHEAAAVAAPSAVQQTPSSDEPAATSNRAVIIFAAVAVAVFILGNWLYLYAFRSPEVTNDDLLQVLPKTTIEKHAAKAEGGDKSDTKKKGSDIIGDTKTVSINDSSTTRSLQAKFKIQGDKPASVSINFTTPKPAELTPEQIVHNEPAPMWLERLETEELSFVENESGGFVANGAAKLYLMQGPNNSRAVAQIQISATFNSEKGELESTILAFTSEKPQNTNEQYSILKDSSGTIKLEFATHVKGAA